jgi:homoserine kinase
LKEILLRAPATIANFGPGFDIFALALDGPFNRFRIRLNDSGRITVRLTGDDEGIPTSPENNTAGLAAIHFFRRISSSAGAEIEIIMGMRSGSGLGSSAASAAACVVGLNKLCGSGLPDRDLIEIASQGEVASGGTPHADNAAACLLGGFVLVTSYRPLGFCRIRVPDIPLVVGVMHKPQQTTRRLIPNTLSLPEVKEQMSSCARLIQALMAADLEGFGAAVNTDYISEPVRSSFIPGYREFKEKALAAGAFGCNVSGGGSSVFAVCPPARTEAVAGLMTDIFRRASADCRVLVTRAGNAGVVEVDEL